MVDTGALQQAHGRRMQRLKVHCPAPRSVPHRWQAAYAGVRHLGALVVGRAVVHLGGTQGGQAGKDCSTLVQCHAGSTNGAWPARCWGTVHRQATSGSAACGTASAGRQPCASMQQGHFNRHAPELAYVSLTFLKSSCPASSCSDSPKSDSLATTGCVGERVLSSSTLLALRGERGRRKAHVRQQGQEDKGFKMHPWVLAIGTRTPPPPQRRTTSTPPHTRAPAHDRSPCMMPRECR